MTRHRRATAHVAPPDVVDACSQPGDLCFDSVDAALAAVHRLKIDIGP